MAQATKGAVDSKHCEDLLSLLSSVELAVSLDSRCEYADPHGAPPRNREAFNAHFSELQTPLQEWDRAVERVRLANDGLWGWFARSAAALGIAEPLYSVGALIDRLATWTVERSRADQLEVPHSLHSQHFNDVFDERPFVSVYVEGQKVAVVPGRPEEDLSQRVEAAERLIQDLFNEAQTCAPAREISDAHYSLLDLKQPLLERITQASQGPIWMAGECPVCRSRM